jgi:hypothetical protein
MRALRPALLSVADERDGKVIKIMNTDHQELMERVSQLREEDLLRIVYGDPSHNRPEAIAYAKAEMKLRGLSLDDLERRKPDDTRVLLPLEAVSRKIRNVMWANLFGIGFVIGLIPFIWMNIDSYNQMYTSSCSDCFVYFGYPFYLYQTGGFVGPTLILWDGLIGNAAIAISTSFCTAWIVNRVLNRVAARYRV